MPPHDPILRAIPVEIGKTVGVDRLAARIEEEPGQQPDSPKNCGKRARQQRPGEHRKSAADQIAGFAADQRSNQRPADPEEASEHPLREADRPLFNEARRVKSCLGGAANP